MKSSRVDTTSQYFVSLLTYTGVLLAYWYSVSSYAGLSSTQIQIIRQHNPVKYCLTAKELNGEFDFYTVKLSRQLHISTQQRLKKPSDNITDCMLISPALLSSVPDSYIQQLVQLRVSPHVFFKTALSELRDKKIAVVADTLSPFVTQQFPDATILQIEGYPQGIELIKQQAIDAFVGFSALDAGLLSANDLQQLSGSEFELAFAVGMAQPLAAVSDVIANAGTEDTSYRSTDSVQAHWFFDYIWFWLATFVLLVLFLAYRYYTLALNSLMLDSKNFELDLKNKALLDLQEQLRARNKKLEYLSTHDSLTSLANRHFFNETVLKELNRAVRHNSQLSLLLIDMDNFKAINDTYGHSVGDKVLIETAQVLKKQVRSIDIVGRWGGEEFIILLPNTSIKDATMLANRICEAVMEQNITPVQKLSCSIGVSRFKDGDSLDTVFIRADKALYEAKALGKNRAESLE